MSDPWKSIGVSLIRNDRSCVSNPFTSTLAIYREQGAVAGCTSAWRYCASRFLRGPLMQVAPPEHIFLSSASWPKDRCHPREAIAQIDDSPALAPGDTGVDSQSK